MLAEMQAYIVAATDPLAERMERYRFDLVGCCHEVFGVQLWRGCHGAPGQFEIASHLSDVRIKLEARILWEAGHFWPTVGDVQIRPEEGSDEHFDAEVALIEWQETKRQEIAARGHLVLDFLDPHWLPGNVIRNVVAVMGGHKLGKSVLSAFLLLWLTLTCPEITGAVYAPKVEKTKRTVWRYVDFILDGIWAPAHHDLSDLEPVRQGRGEARLTLGHAKTIETQATRVSGGQGSSIVQGEHGSAGVHLFEEAEGITAPEIYDGVRSMVGSGIQFWFWTLNPASGTSTAQQFIDGPEVRSMSLSCTDHPNVVQGRTVVPGAITRADIELKLGGKAAWAERVGVHDPKRATFELTWLPGIIYRPFAPWWWRVWGRTPPGSSHDSIISSIVFRAAEKRGDDWRATFEATSPVRGRLGVDVARSESGDGDLGAIARKWRGCLEVVDELNVRDTRPYVSAIAARLGEMADGGCRHVEVLIDNGGGFGGGVADQVRDLPVLDRFATAEVILVDFGGKPSDPRSYADWITEAYVAVGEALETLALVDPSPRLEEDLCARKVHWVDVSLGDEKPSVRKLERKEDFHRRVHRSPDRGDAVALACGPAPHKEAEGGFKAVSERRWEPGEAKPTRRKRRDR